MFRSIGPPNYPGGARTYLNRRGILLLLLFVLTASASGAYGAYAGLFVKEQCNYCSGNKFNKISCEQCLGSGKIVGTEVCSACDGELQFSSTEACYNCGVDGTVYWLLPCSV